MEVLDYIIRVSPRFLNHKKSLDKCLDEFNDFRYGDSHVFEFNKLPPFLKIVDFLNVENIRFEVFYDIIVPKSPKNYPVYILTSSVEFEYEQDLSANTILFDDTKGIMLFGDNIKELINRECENLMWKAYSIKNHKMYAVVKIKKMPSPIVVVNPVEIIKRNKPNNTFDIISDGRYLIDAKGVDFVSSNSIIHVNKLEHNSQTYQIYPGLILISGPLLEKFILSGAKGVPEECIPVLTPSSQLLAIP
jgi:hypothetical protein